MRIVAVGSGNVSAAEDGIPSERDHTAAPRPGVVLDQRDLVERAKRGDHDAFATLAGGAIARLDAAARLILRDPELARDGVQDGYIRAWRTLPALRDPDRFDAWLRRLVVHACIDIMRRRRHRAIEVELTPLDVAAGVDFTSTIADRDEVEGALRRLDPELVAKRRDRRSSPSTGVRRGSRSRTPVAWAAIPRPPGNGRPTTRPSSERRPMLRGSSSDRCCSTPLPARSERSIWGGSTEPSWQRLAP